MEEPAPTQLAHTCTTEDKRWGQTDPQITSWWERPTKERPNKNPNQRHTQSQQKPQPKISKIRRSGDCTQNLTGILPQKFTPKTQGVRTEQLKKQRLTGRISQTMGRQRNNPQMKGKGEVSETMLNEKRGKSTLRF